MNKKGFAVLEIIIVVIMLLLVAGGIWYYEINAGSMSSLPNPPCCKTTPVEPIPQNPKTTNSSTVVVPPPPSMPPASPTTGTNTSGGQAGPITSASVGEIPASKTFSLTAYPLSSFTIGNIYFGTGGVSNSYCAGLYPGGSSYIFIKDQPPGSSPSGTCIDASQQIDGQNMRVVAFTLTVNDNNSSDIYGTFVRGTYELPNGTSGNLYRIAQTNPPWAGYGASAYTSQNIVIGLEIPIDVTQMNLYYGNYPEAGQATSEANFNDAGGYTIDFSTKTIKAILD